MFPSLKKIIKIKKKNKIDNKMGNKNGTYEDQHHKLFLNCDLNIL